MRVFSGFGFAILLSTAAFAQGFHGGFFNPQPTVQGGFGSVVFPGGTSAVNPAIQRGFGSVVFPGGGGPRLNVPLSNQAFPRFGDPRRGLGGQRRDGGRAGGFNNGAIYAVPVYVGGYGGYYSGYNDNPYPADAAPGGPPAPQQPNVIVVYPQAPQPTVIDRSAALAPEQPQAGLTQPYAEPAPAVETARYLIAFKDHTIYSAIAYWVEGDTLHYFTSGNTHNQVSLTLVDRDLTDRLNKEAGSDMRLPR